MPPCENHEDFAPGGDTGRSNHMEGLDWESLTLAAPETSVMPGHLTTYRPARTQFASALLPVDAARASALEARRPHDLQANLHVVVGPRFV